MNEYEFSTYATSPCGFIAPRMGVQVKHTSGITVSCSSERGLHANKAKALAECMELVAQSKAPKAQKDPKVLVSKAALAMILNALRRDAAEGRVIRGEMADMIEASYEEQ